MLRERKRHSAKVQITLTKSQTYITNHNGRGPLPPPDRGVQPRGDGPAGEALPEARSRPLGLDLGEGVPLRARAAGEPARPARRRRLRPGRQRGGRLQG